MSENKFDCIIRPDPKIAVQAEKASHRAESDEIVAKAKRSKLENKNSGVVAKGLLRPTDRMENPFIGKDGKDYHTSEVLKQADKDYRIRRHPKPVNEFIK